jgi:NAD(P)-dependent dehydrogenase (short-subunit alcohol dehydrogenase family)
MAPLSVITGTTHGIGRVTAGTLARAGHRIVMLCRNQPLAESVASAIRSSLPAARIESLHCDLADLATVHAASASIRERHGPIDRLILNAGIATTTPQRTASGMDMNFAVNHLGHFLLVELLRDAMASQGRIITVASLAHEGGRLNLDAVADPQERIGSIASYARSKLANVQHSFALARRLAGSTVTANCLHPGVIATSLLPRWVQFFQRFIRGQMFDETRGAQTTLHLALAPDLDGANGVYFDEFSRPKQASALARDVALQEALWQRSLQWAGIQPFTRRD